MTEEATSTAPETPAEPAVVSPPAEVKPAEAKPETDWKAEARKHEQRAKENAAKAKQLDEILESQKTDQQKLADAATAAEARALAAERKAIGLEHGLPPELAARLKGNTAEELAADAAALKALIPAAPPADVDQGVKNGGKGGPAQLTQAELARMSPAQIVKAQAEGRLNDLLGIK